MAHCLESVRDEDKQGSVVDYESDAKKTADVLSSFSVDPFRSCAESEVMVSNTDLV